jgi:uncharacterized protein (TIGR02271 family)
MRLGGTDLACLGLDLACLDTGAFQPHQEVKMKQTVVGVFDSEVDAQRAMQTLAQTEVDASHVRATSAEGTVTHPETGVMGKVRNFFSDMFATDDDPELGHYAEAVRRGGAVVRVDIDDDDTAALERVRHVLQDAGAVDLDERVEAWRAQGLTEDRSVGTAPVTAATAGGVTGTRLGATDRTEDVIPVVKEDLAIGKRVVSTGGVRVYAHTVETPVSESVQLRTEHAEVQRRPVDRPATAADLADLKDRTLEVRETAEQPVVQKRARVVEEVRVGKTVEQRTEQVHDTVRSTEVEVERLGGRDFDDAYFRNDYASRFGNLGGRYEDYEPAYRYGHSLASDPRYAGRSWDDFEADARADWERRYPGSTWERMKAAVRHGWERVKH